MRLRLGQVDQRIKLDTLVRLRWLAIAGQFTALLVVAFGLGYHLPLEAGLGLVALSAFLNLLVKIRFPASRRLGDGWATGMLAFDVCQLSALLFLTGGLGNPFSVLLIAPVVVSSTALGVRNTVLLSALVILAATLLAVVHLPLPWREPGGVALSPVYLAGVWIALVSALAFMVTYSWRVAEEARQLQAALAATELVLSREQHMNQLDGLAAAAAHELGTPLATIALVAKELYNGLDKASPMREDLTLLRDQAQRCREILRKLTSLSGEFHGHLHAVPVSHLVEDLVAPHRDSGIDITVHVEGERDDEPTSERDPGIVHGLANILENAADFARTRVDVTVRWTGERVAVVVEDDGPGFSREVLERIGEPYTTTRRRDGAAAGRAEAAADDTGAGLGFFVAKTLLERSGARLHIVNRKAPQTGAMVEVRWPRESYGADPA
jgi:Signal transduction histidine kinase